VPLVGPAGSGVAAASAIGVCGPIRAIWSAEQGGWAPAGNATDSPQRTPDYFFTASRTRQALVDPGVIPLAAVLLGGRLPGPLE
jgi:hypothetical protein